jgi:hypothetical protein
MISSDKPLILKSWTPISQNWFLKTRREFEEAFHLVKPTLCDLDPSRLRLWDFSPLFHLLSVTSNRKFLKEIFMWLEEKVLAWPHAFSHVCNSPSEFNYTDTTSTRFASELLGSILDTPYTMKRLKSAVNALKKWSERSKALFNRWQSHVNSLRELRAQQPYAQQEV